MKKVVPPGGYIPDPPGPDDDRFARAFKNWREWNVAVEFLTNLHFGVDESEVFALESDPPDVIFHDARFEVKEIMDPRRRRHDEVKAAQLHAKANQGKAATEMYAAEDLTPVDVGTLVLTELNRLDQKRYLLDGREAIDLLFYVNKLEHWFRDGLCRLRNYSKDVDGARYRLSSIHSRAWSFLLDLTRRTSWLKTSALSESVGSLSTMRALDTAFTDHSPSRQPSPVVDPSCSDASLRSGTVLIAPDRLEAVESS